MQPSFTALSHLGLLEISGQDAKKFLQGQITCDLNEVTPTQSRLGAHCDLKGRMQSIFRVALAEAEDKQAHYFLSMPLEMIPFALQHFKKYALFSKVNFNDASSLSKIGLCGKEAPLLLAALPDKPLLCCEVPGVEPRYEIYATPAFMDSLLSHVKSTEIHPWQRWELLDIQQGLPTIYPATMNLFLPHHANFSILGGISYTKGCYLGQEIIARMHYKGKIKKHMYRVGMDLAQALPAPGTPLFLKEEQVGTVVRAAEGEALVILDEQRADFEKLRFKLLTLPYAV